MSRMVAAKVLNGGGVIRLIHGDITEERVDAIVNAANSHLVHGGGVAGAIVRAGGESIQIESEAWIREHGLVSHDSPAITGAGRLPCRYVIHAVGPIWGEGDEDAKLAAAVLGALNLAAERGFTSVSLPAISTGIFGFPKERGARVILDSIERFLSAKGESTIGEVRITLIDDASVQVFHEEFTRRWADSMGGE